jgi:hypothetical protein
MRDDDSDVLANGAVVGRSPLGIMRIARPRTDTRRRARPRWRRSLGVGGGNNRLSPVTAAFGGGPRRRIALLCFFLTLFASPFKSKSRLEAENAALRHQLVVLRRKVRGRLHLKSRARPLAVHHVRPRGTYSMVGYSISNRDDQSGCHRNERASLWISIFTFSEAEAALVAYGH